MKMDFIEESQLYKFVPELNKSRVAFKKNDGTIYIAAYENTKITGFVGYKVLRDSIRLKTDFVVEDCRNRGVYDQLFVKRLKIIKDKFGDVRMTAFCTPMSLGTYVRRGFIKKSIKNNITFVTREAI